MIVMANATPAEMVEVDGVLYQPSEAPKPRKAEPAQAKEAQAPANKARAAATKEG